MTKYYFIALTENEIKEQGGIFVKTETHWDCHLCGYIQVNLYRLGTCLVSSKTEYKFLG